MTYSLGLHFGGFQIERIRAKSSSSNMYENGNAIPLIKKGIKQ